MPLLVVVAINLCHSVTPNYVKCQRDKCDSYWLNSRLHVISIAASSFFPRQATSWGRAVGKTVWLDNHKGACWKNADDNLSSWRFLPLCIYCLILMWWHHKLPVLSHKNLLYDLHLCQNDSADNDSSLLYWWRSGPWRLCRLYVWWQKTIKMTTMGRRTMHATYRSHFSKYEQVRIISIRCTCMTAISSKFRLDWNSYSQYHLRAKDSSAGKEEIKIR